jgi:hypothetical protein
LFDEGFRHNCQVIADYALANCTFEGFAGFVPDWSNPDPRLRPTIRDVTLWNTNACSAFLEGAIIDEVTVNTTKVGKAPLFLRGSVYRHATLKGRIGRIEIRGKMFPPLDLPKEDRERIEFMWDLANAAYYQTVDWALDITQARYGSLSISGVPAKMIRRNPENTAVVTRERAMSTSWQDIPVKNRLFSNVISQFIGEGYDDVVLIACPRSKRYNEQIADLQILRDSGAAE